MKNANRTVAKESYIESDMEILGSNGANRSAPESGGRIRNMAVGILISAIGVALAVLGAVLGGMETMAAIIAVLVSFLMIRALWRSGVFEQPAGWLLTLGFLLFAGGFVAVLHGILLVSDATPKKQAPSGQVSGLPLLTEHFPVRRPNPSQEPAIKVTKDWRVMIGNRVYLLLAGELLPLEAAEPNALVFRAGNLRIPLPNTAGQLLNPTPDIAVETKPAVAQASEPESAPPPGPTPPLEATAKPEPTPVGGNRTEFNLVMKAAQEEAVRRYPLLGVADSRENKAYVAAYKHLQQNNPEYFKNPEWPLRLAEALAKREGWREEP